MSKAKVRDPDISDEYDFSTAKRGVYYERARKGTHVSLVHDDAEKASADNGSHETATKPRRK